VTVAVEDGRAYLAASKEKFDVIMVDAYQDITIPFQLSSVEFFNEVCSHLKPNGVMVVNLNMTSAEDGSINEYLCDTMASVFQHTVTAPVRGNTNTEVFCTNADDWEETFLRSIAKLKDSDYADMMRTVYSKLTPYEGGSCILTDDKAPVEVLGMRVLDELIGDELNYYKDELRTGGLSALIGN
jgi:spermidine synthase